MNPKSFSRSLRMRQMGMKLNNCLILKKTDVPALEKMRRISPTYVQEKLIVCLQKKCVTYIHALFLIRDVAKLPGLLSPNFSRFFRAAVPYLSLIFCPFLYPCVSYDFIKILKFLAASLQNEKSIFCLLLISTLPLASLIFPENSSPVSY